MPTGRLGPERAYPPPGGPHGRAAGEPTTEVGILVLPIPTSCTEIKCINWSTRRGSPFLFKRKVILIMPRGRPRKVYSKVRAIDEELHKPHASWDFTDPKLFVDGVLDPARLAVWERWCDRDGCKYCEIAAETSETGYKHGQGRIVFRRGYRMTQLKKLMPEPHWEPTCCKHDCLYLRKHDSETVLKWDGRCQGVRNVFKEQAALIVEGGTIRDCALLDGANYQSIRSAELLMAYTEPERPCAPREVHLVTSPSSVMPAGIYRLRSAAFWDGYDGHKAIFIDQPLLKLSLGVLRQICGPAPFRAGRHRQALHD